MAIYILTKFGADRLIFVDDRVLTRKLWTDGHRRTVSDHNSSLSTPCSDELKKKKNQATSEENRYRAGFELVLKLISVTSTNSWTNHTMKDCHLHNNFHTINPFRDNDAF